MSKLEQLPQISEHVLSGLRADDALKKRIYQKAVQADTGNSRSFSRRGALIALCGLSAVMIAVFVILGSLPSGSRNAGDPASVQIQTLTAGEQRTESPIQLQEIIDETVRQYEEEDDPETVESAEEDAVDAEDPEEHTGDETDSASESVAP